MNRRNSRDLGLWSLCAPAHHYRMYTEARTQEQGTKSMKTIQQTGNVSQRSTVSMSQSSALLPNGQKSAQMLVDLLRAFAQRTAIEHRGNLEAGYPQLRLLNTLAREIASARPTECKNAIRDGLPSRSRKARCNDMRPSGSRPVCCHVQREVRGRVLVTKPVCCKLLFC
jgi:hypothetical protein